MSHLSTNSNIPVVTIKLNGNKSAKDEDDSLSICSGSSSSESNYNFKNRYSSLSNNDDDNHTSIRLNRRSYSSLSQYNNHNNLSVRINMNRSSPIYEEKSDDCQSDTEVTATYKLNSIKNRKYSPKQNGKIFLRKSDTVIEVKNDLNDDESEESVSFSFKPPGKNKSKQINEYNGEYNKYGNYNGNNDKSTDVESEEKRNEINGDDEARKQFFIGKYKNIDEILGNLFKMIEDTSQSLNAEELMEDFYEVEASAVKVHDNKALNAKVKKEIN